jgi:hypothetical protein
MADVYGVERCLEMIGGSRCPFYPVFLHIYPAVEINIVK